MSTTTTPVTTPPSNVVAPAQGWGNWPMNPIYPPQRPGPMPPSCFSELYALNQCYNDIQMMTQILTKVVCDAATNNTAFAQCLANAIAKVGASTTPITGVTDGSNAQPGIVGEYVQMEQTVTYPATTINLQPVTMGVLQPGDWDCWAALQPNGFGGGSWFILNPVPAGFSTVMLGESLSQAAGLEAYATLGMPARASISTPTLVVFNLTTNFDSDATAVSTSAQFYFGARRAR